MKTKSKMPVAWLAILAVALGSASTATAQLFSQVGGNVLSGNSATTCEGACPPGFNAAYCDRSTNTQCAESSGTIPGRGTVLGRACSDHGILRARATNQPSGTAHIDFGASASFHDFVTLSNGIGPAIVRVTFQTRGTQNGSISASAEYWLGNTNDVGVPSLPPSTNVTLEAQVQIGMAFPLGARLDVGAGPSGPFCPAAIAGESDDADYYSGDSGLRITRFEVFATNGMRLTNVSATGSSGTRYDTAPPAIVEVSTPAPGVFQFRIQGTPGSNYVVESTTRLVSPPGQTSWTSNFTEKADGMGSFQYVIPINAPTFPQRYFRVRTP